MNRVIRGVLLCWIVLTFMLLVLWVKANAQQYPNPILTPGKVLTTDAKVVCTPGYAKSVRAVTESEKQKVFKDYGIVCKQCGKFFEVDHLISLELGGSNDSDNLWPQRYLPKPGAREKDKVENWLHRQVCSGKMPLVEAQKQIVEDWYHTWECEMGMPDLTVQRRKHHVQ